MEEKIDTYNCDIAIGAVIGTKYILLKELGSGRYSHVWLSINRKGILNAIKIHKADSYDNGIIESNILNAFNSEFIVKCHDKFVIVLENKKHYCVVIDFLGMSLADYINETKKRDIKIINKITTQINDAIKHIHSKGLIHTDLKPENILLTKIFNPETKAFLEKIKKFDFVTRLGRLQKKNSVKDSMEKISKNIIDFFIDHCPTNKIASDNDTTCSDQSCCEDANESSVANSSDRSVTEYYNRSLIFSDNTESSTDGNDPTKSSSSESSSGEYSTNESSASESSSESSSSESNISEKPSTDKFAIYNIDDFNIKVVDLGTCRKINDNASDIQTRYYRAPEVILGINYNEKVDVWSLGCILYELVTGKILFSPSKNDLGSRDRLHIYLICDALNEMIPASMIEKSRRKQMFFTCKNHLKGYYLFDESDNRVHDELVEINKEIKLLEMIAIDPEKRNYFS